MTKKELKYKAQDAIMNAISSAFYANEDNSDLNEKEKEKMRKELDKQMKRIEKLFGYEEGSCSRF